MAVSVSGSSPVAHLPLILGMLRKLEMAALIDEVVPPHPDHVLSCGLGVAALGLAILDGDHALYKVGSRLEERGMLSLLREGLARESLTDRISATSGRPYTGGIHMALPDSLKALFIETSKVLTGSSRRLLMARTVKDLGPGGPRRAERALGWNRSTIRNGTPALASGFICREAFSARGRKRAAVHVPPLRDDLRASVEGQSQNDPQFRTQRWYPRISAAAVRRQLLAQTGDPDTEWPTGQTITATLNTWGYLPKKVATSKPPKNSRQPTPSSLICIRAIPRPLRPQTSGACLSRPKRRSQAVPFPGGAKAGPRPRPLITIASPRRWGRLGASGCPPRMQSFSLAAWPQSPAMASPIASPRGGNPFVHVFPTAPPA
jgi:hypothetical protein